MSEALNNLNDEYKQMKKEANSREEKQDYNNWKNEVLNRINSEKYQTNEEAKEIAKERL